MKKPRSFTPPPPPNESSSHLKNPNDTFNDLEWNLSDDNVNFDLDNSHFKKYSSSPLLLAGGCDHSGSASKSGGDMGGCDMSGGDSGGPGGGDSGGPGGGDSGGPGGDHGGSAGEGAGCTGTSATS